MGWKNEWKKLLAIIAVFVGCFYLRHLINNISNRFVPGNDHYLFPPIVRLSISWPFRSTSYISMHTTSVNALN